MNITDSAEPTYVMAFSAEESRGLQTMAELLALTTRRLLEKAGIRACQPHNFIAMPFLERGRIGAGMRSSLNRYGVCCQ
jgi:hypothetical protein